MMKHELLLRERYARPRYKSRSGTLDHNDSGHAVEFGNDYAVAIKAGLDRELVKGAARLKAILEDAHGNS
ncbi:MULTISPECIES: hypothetical protein [Bradyrhizobium]|uniref:hypothetical protein n=1 Tax=Bradyrhizobium TaxID=374 RepID=UPI00054E35BA|nr:MULTISPECIES: hypothetical protein [Bradyrhizobium]UFW51460.1 hypothetical protein BaraCB756_10995 [Bradyrhizobium arachidis]